MNQTTTADTTKNQEPAKALFVPIARKDARAKTYRPSISYWQDAWMRLRKNKVAMTAAVYVALVVTMALVVPELVPYAYDEQEVWNKHSPPTLGDEALVIDHGSSNYKPITAEPLTEQPAGEVIDPPPPPTGLRFLEPPNSEGAKLAWEQVPGAERYKVYRAQQPDSPGLELDSVPASVLSFFDNSKLTPHKEFYYSVTAENAMGESLASESIKATTILAIELKDALLIDKNATIGGLITTRAHLLGTDYQGRDMLVRVMVGARISLLIGFMAPFLYVLIGIIYGSIAGFFGGLVDDIMMRITDIVTTVPELLVVIMLQVVMGTGVTTLIAAMVLVAWSRSARQIRGEVLRLREMEFVQASTILGTPFPKVVVRHLLPNVMGTVLVVLTLSIPSAIFTEAFLSFIGLGIEPPMPSWGIVAKEAAQAFESYPLELVIPSLFISSTMLAFNLLGDGLRDALDPKLRGAR